MLTHEHMHNIISHFEMFFIAQLVFMFTVFSCLNPLQVNYPEPHITYFSTIDAGFFVFFYSLLKLID